MVSMVLTIIPIGIIIFLRIKATIEMDRKNLLTIKTGLQVNRNAIYVISKI